MNRFLYRVVQGDDSGYYHVRWDGAVPVAVVARSEPEARAQIAALMGPCQRGWSWRCHLDSVAPACCDPKPEQP